MNIRAPHPAPIPREATASRTGRIAHSLAFLMTFVLSLLAVGAAAPVTDASGTYDRAAAVAYAREHWNDGATVPWLPDCTAFASQALWAGGLSKSDKWTNSSRDRQQVATRVVRPGPTKAMMAADVLKNYLVNETGQGTLTQISYEDRSIPGAEAGDLVLYDWNADGFVDHIAFIVATGPSETLVAQHTPNQVDKGWNWSSTGNNWLSQTAPSTRVYLLHITA